MSRGRSLAGMYDGRVAVLVGVLALTLAFSLWVVPWATAPTAPDAVLGAVQLVWWAMWNVVALLVVHLVVRPPAGLTSGRPRGRTLPSPSKEGDARLLRFEEGDAP